MIKHDNVNLLFFLNSITGSVLDSLTGEFEKTAKYRFGNVRKAIDRIEKDLINNCTDSAIRTYQDSNIMVAEVLNLAINAYNKGEIDKFLSYCKNYENIEK